MLGFILRHTSGSESTSLVTSTALQKLLQRAFFSRLRFKRFSLTGSCSNQINGLIIYCLFNIYGFTRLFISGFTKKLQDQTQIEYETRAHQLDFCSRSKQVGQALNKYVSKCIYDTVSQEKYSRSYFPKKICYPKKSRRANWRNSQKADHNSTFYQ